MWSRIWSYLLKNSLMKTSFFVQYLLWTCAVQQSAHTSIIIVKNVQYVFACLDHRGLFWTLSNIYDWTFGRNSLRLHIRYLPGVWIRLWIICKIEWSSHISKIIFNKIKTPFSQNYHAYVLIWEIPKYKISDFTDRFFNRLAWLDCFNLVCQSSWYM